jgi:hypothetical protein
MDFGFSTMEQKPPAGVPVSKRKIMDQCAGAHERWNGEPNRRGTGFAPTKIRGNIYERSLGNGAKLQSQAI